MVSERLGAPDMHGWMTDLFPLNRSLTGPGTLATLEYLAELMPGMQIQSWPTGHEVGDWTIAPEWHVSEAWIEDLSASSATRVIDIADHNLHLVGYSTAVDQVMSRTELEPHLHSLPDQPDAIPYVTSYYERTWGFCLTHNQRSQLSDGPFRVVVRSEHVPGHMHYGEIVIPGERPEEILLSSYVCHPSMANNELSGPVVLAAIAQELLRRPRRYTYRIVFVPETIGSIAYIAEHAETLRKNVIAGWVLTCVGDEKAWSFLPSRNDHTLADKVSRRALASNNHGYTTYDWSTRGSDERQWCAPGVDLPVCSIMRSKYHVYPEYHTSLDDLDFVSQNGLAASYHQLMDCIDLLETEPRWVASRLGEPHLRKHDFAATAVIDGVETALSSMDHLTVHSWCDGTNHPADIAERSGLSTAAAYEVLNRLAHAGVIDRQ